MATVFRFIQDLVCRTVPRVEFTSNRFLKILRVLHIFSDHAMVLKITNTGESTLKMAKREKHEYLLRTNDFATSR